nr:imidazoleglycerol-phosphate synthase subunit H - like [Arabidopsis thaliana]
MTKEIEQGASSSSSKTIVSVGETSAGPEPAKPDLPIFQ